MSYFHSDMVVPERKPLRSFLLPAATSLQRIVNFAYSSNVCDHERVACTSWLGAAGTYCDAFLFNQHTVLPRKCPRGRYCFNRAPGGGLIRGGDINFRCAQSQGKVQKNCTKVRNFPRFSIKLITDHRYYRSFIGLIPNKSLIDQ